MALPSLASRRTIAPLAFRAPVPTGVGAAAALAQRATLDKAPTLANLKSKLETRTTSAPRVVAMPQHPSTSASGPNLPVPGHSGLGWIRDAQLPVRGGATPAPAGRGAPAPGPGAIAAKRGLVGKLPFGRTGALADPNGKTVSDVLGRFDQSPDARHAALFGRLPDVGGSAPFQGRRFVLPNGRMGGVPSFPAPVNSGVAMPSPIHTANAGSSSPSSPKNLRRSIAQLRREQKPFTRLHPGVGGLEIAMGPRVVPDAPSGVREALRDRRPLKLRTSQALQSATPGEVVDELGRTRARTPAGIIASSPESSPVSTFGPSATETPNQSDAPPVARAAGLSAGMLAAVALVALMVIR